jgi:hypothetical protein
MAKTIPARDLQAIFLPRGRRPFLIPANDQHEVTTGPEGGSVGIFLMLAIFGAVCFFLATGGTL